MPGVDGLRQGDGTSPLPSKSEAWKDWAAAGLLLLVILGIMAPTFSWTLRNDDLFHIGRAHTLMQGAGLLTTFTHSQQDFEKKEYGWSQHAAPNTYYRPVTDLLFALDYALYGLRHPGYRLTNALIYLLSALAVYGIAVLCLSSRAIGLTAALLFVTNVGHANTIVAQIAGRTDSLVGLFVLTCFFFFLLYRRTQGRRYAVLTVATMALALFTKETAIGLPVILFLYDLLFLRPWRVRRLGIHVFSGLTTIGYLATRLALLDGIGELTLAWPTNLYRLAHFVKIPFDNILHRSLIPGDLTVFVLLFAALGAVLLWLYWPVLRRNTFHVRFALFSVAAFYLAAGPAPLLRLGGSLRWYYAATGFLLIWMSSVLVGSIKIALEEGGWMRWIRSSVPAVLLVLLIGSGLVVFRGSLEPGRAASALTEDLQHSLDRELADVAPGDKLFLVTLPAGCASQGIFYNGFQDWIALTHGTEIRPFVLSMIIFEQCERPTHSGIQVSMPAEGLFDVRLTTQAPLDEIVLSQTALARLALDETIENRYETVTLTDAENVSVTLRGRTGYKRVPKGIQITVKKSLLDAPGDNHFLYFDGHRLRRFSADDGDEPASPLSGSSEEDAQSRVSIP